MRDGKIGFVSVRSVEIGPGFQRVFEVLADRVELPEIVARRDRSDV
jgi:hypothetical protein